MQIYLLSINASRDVHPDRYLCTQPNKAYYQENQHLPDDQIQGHFSRYTLLPATHVPDLHLQKLAPTFLSVASSPDQCLRGQILCVVHANEKPLDRVLYQAQNVVSSLNHKLLDVSQRVCMPA